MFCGRTFSRLAQPFRENRLKNVYEGRLHIHVLQISSAPKRHTHYTLGGLHLRAGGNGN